MLHQTAVLASNSLLHQTAVLAFFAMPSPPMEGGRVPAVARAAPDEGVARFGAAIEARDVSITRERSSSTYSSDDTYSSISCEELPAKAAPAKAAPAARREMRPLRERSRSRVASVRRGPREPNTRSSSTHRRRELPVNAAQSKSASRRELQRRSPIHCVARSLRDEAEHLAERAKQLRTAADLVEGDGMAGAASSSVPAHWRRELPVPSAQCKSASRTQHGPMRGSVARAASPCSRPYGTARKAAARAAAPCSQPPGTALVAKVAALPPPPAPPPPRAPLALCDLPRPPSYPEVERPAPGTRAASQWRDGLKRGTGAWYRNQERARQNMIEDEMDAEFDRAARSGVCNDV